ncbi:hypothetical protein HDF26_001008 [Pedobacter cryoconitis]|uniref:hypothetical protein n=1 Tax=Pedobacter cryoconitis TaxID=188932 RepID=UPI001608C344|nr:hypothetical protein [Pedobacter cryoconitis]MBB6270581.1 hypothetical protein [Pedobacter cryoconitis]
MKKKLMNTEKAKTHLILFGSITDPGSGGGGGDPGGGGGGGGGSGGGNCAQEAQSLINGTSITNTLLSSDIYNIDATNRTILYTWIVINGPLGVWRYESRDLGTQQKVGGAWQWVSIVHQSVTLAGYTTGFTLTYTDVLPPNGIVVGPTTAYMELNFSLRLTFNCVGNPYDVPIYSPGEGIAKKTFIAS